MILRKAEDEESRKAVWTAGMNSDEERLEVLEGMLDVRRRIAGLVGRSSWGETELENKMAGNPGQSGMRETAFELTADLLFPSFDTSKPT